MIVELDGGQHSERPNDGQRDSRLCALGYRVIRIWNNDVLENVDGVLQALLRELEKPPLTPSLSPQAAGLSGENWTVVRAERFAANFGCESPLPGLVPGTHGVPSMFNSLEVQVLYPS